jgi:hypothetical protein
LLLAFLGRDEVTHGIGLFPIPPRRLGGLRRLESRVFNLEVFEENIWS